MIKIQFQPARERTHALAIGLKFDTSLEPFLRGFGFTRDQTRMVLKALAEGPQTLVLPNSTDVLKVWRK